MKRIVAVIGLLLLCSPFLGAGGQIEFVAKVVSVNVDLADPEIGTLQVALIAGAQIQVLVNGSTEIEDEDGDPISLSEIQPGSFVRVEGIFTAGGILALEIRVGSESADIALRGRIDAVREDVREIDVNSFTIEVPVDAEIKDFAGNPLVFEDLAVGQFVKVEGNLVEGRLVATEIKLITPEAATARVRFEGIVTDLTDGTLDVSIEGLGPVTVLITAETTIEGDLAVGKLVRVWGRLTAGLAVEARRIVVVPFVRLAPNRLKMGFEQTRTVHVVLQTLQDEDVELSLSSLVPEIAEPEEVSIVIPAGSLNGTFDVSSKTIEGETTIEVGLPAALGGGHTDLHVSVHDRPEGDEKTQRIHWIPSRLNMGMNAQRRVVLQLRHPAEEEIQVALTMTKGPADLVFPDHVVFPAGERRVPVAVESGATAGRAEVEAVLPEALGGDSDLLQIEIRGPRPAKRGLEWVPAEVTLSPETSVVVKLTLAKAPDEEMKVLLSVNPRERRLVSFPSEVIFPVGTTEVDVEILALELTGTAKILAAFPFRKGGDHDTLVVRIED